MRFLKQSTEKLNKYARPVGPAHTTMKKTCHVRNAHIFCRTFGHRISLFVTSLVLNLGDKKNYIFVFTEYLFYLLVKMNGLLL